MVTAGRSEPVSSPGTPLSKEAGSRYLRETPAGMVMGPSARGLLPPAHGARGSELHSVWGACIPGLRVGVGGTGHSDRVRRVRLGRWAGG